MTLLLLLWRTLFGLLVGLSGLGSTTFRRDALLFASFGYQPIIMAEMTVLAELADWNVAIEVVAPWALGSPLTLPSQELVA